MVQLPTAIYSNPYKITIAFFFFLVEMEKKPILKFIWNCEGAGIAKINLEKSKIGGLTFPNLVTYKKAVVI